MRGFNCAFILISILLVTIDAFVPSQRIHEDIPHDLVTETFDTPKILGEYEDAPINKSHISKRYLNQPNSLHMKSMGNDFFDWLEPNEGVLFSTNTPILSVATTSAGPQFVQYRNAMETYYGYIHRDYIRTYHNKRRKRQVDEIELDNLINRSSIKNNDKNDHQNSTVHEYTINNTSESSSRTKRASRNVVYPEILVIVDYDLFKLHGSDIYTTVKYIVGYWNGVDLAFRALESPKFRLNIVAVIIAKDATALSYMSSNKVGSGYVHINPALQAFQYWLYDSLSSVLNRNSYDVAVTMTGLQMCNVGSNRRVCVPGITGLANLDMACNVDDYYHVVYKTVIVNDNGGFSGIHSTAHELGHTFGAAHDGDPNYNQCTAYTDSIMGPKVATGPDAGNWSPCSLAAIDYFLKTKGTCLYNRPNHNGKMHTYLPGKLMDANGQCNVLQGTKAATIDSTICQKLPCYVKNSGFTSSAIQGYAAVGTRCGPGKICFHGDCIMEPALLDD